ncbi:MAG: hypothetical protein KIT22_16045 [Verrucomicrobiae bacterium]|nr:hypothetical protein [Verrucomicrobiae bacterium]
MNHRPAEVLSGNQLFSLDCACMTNPTMTGSRLFFTMLALLPLLALIVFYAWVIEARMVLGYWPHFGVSYADFNRSGLLSSHSSFANLAICIGVYSSILWLLFLAFRAFHGRFRAIPDFAFRIYFASLILLVVLMFADLGGFFRWFMSS